MKITLRSPAEVTVARGQRPYEFRRDIMSGRIRIHWFAGRPRIIGIVDTSDTFAPTGKAEGGRS